MLLAATCTVKIVMDIIPYLNDLMIDMFMHIVCIVCVIVFFL